MFIVQVIGIILLIIFISPIIDVILVNIMLKIKKQKDMENIETKNTDNNELVMLKCNICDEFYSTEKSSPYNLPEDDAICPECDNNNYGDQP